MNRELLVNLWEAHKNDDWPHVGTHQEGPLMTLDTVISGCVVHVLDGQEELDEQRRVIVSDCLAELDALEIESNDECRSYFNRLRELGTLLLITA